MAVENSYYPNHNLNYPGDHENGSGEFVSPTDLSAHTLIGWDFPIDETSDLLPDLGSTSRTGSGRDRLEDVQNDQNSLSSLLITTNDYFKGLEHSPTISDSEFNKWLNELGKKENKGGRPVKPISYEKLPQCMGRTLKAAAKVLEVSESTLKRHCERLTGYKTWSEFQRSLSVSQRVRGKERMEDEDKDKVSIYVDYKGDKMPFHLSSIAKLGPLQKHIKKCLKLKVGTYDIKYFDGKDDLFILCTDNLEYCLDHAVGGAPIVLKVVERI